MPWAGQLTRWVVMSPVSDVREYGIVVPTDRMPLPIEPSDDVRSW
jgi:hypothetical protein